MPWRSQIYTALQPCYFSCHRRDKSRFNVGEILVGNVHWGIGYFWLLGLKLLGERRQSFDNTSINVDIILKIVPCWKMSLGISTSAFFDSAGKAVKIKLMVALIKPIFFKPLLILTASGFHSSYWVSATIALFYVLTICAYW